MKNTFHKNILFVKIVKRKENKLHRKYKVFGGPTEIATAHQF